MPEKDFLQNKLNFSFVLPLDKAQFNILADGRKHSNGQQLIIDKYESENPGWRYAEHHTDLGWTTPKGYFNYYPMVDAIMEVSRLQAKEILSTSTVPMPIEQECSLRYPGISPKGKYSAIDMRFAQQKSRVDTVSQLYSGTLKNALDKIYGSEGFRQATEKMQEASKQYRLEKTAAKMCRLEPIQEEFNRRAEAYLRDPAVEEYRHIMEGLEYMVGLRQNQPSPEVCQKLTQNYQFPDLQALPMHLSARNTNVETLTVHFDNFEDITAQQMFSDPRNWNQMDMENYRNNLQSALSVFQGIKPYCLSNVKKILDPLSEQAQKHGYNPADLLIIDGESVQERIDKIFPNPDEKTPTAVKEHAALLIANALLSNTRIDAYIPTQDGNIPNKPTRLVSEGYQPRQTPNRVVLNAWERFFSHFGFFKEKAAQAKAYNDHIAENQRSAEAYTKLKNKLQPIRTNSGPTL